MHPGGISPISYIIHRLCVQTIQISSRTPIGTRKASEAGNICTTMRKQIAVGIEGRPELKGHPLYLSLPLPTLAQGFHHDNARTTSFALQGRYQDAYLLPESSGPSNFRDTAARGGTPGELARQQLGLVIANSTRV